MGSEADRTLGALLEELLASGGVTAAAAMVADAYGVLAVARRGSARLRPRVLLAEQHLFDLASLSKPFTATLALRLDAAGLLPLELPIGEVWPKAPRALARRTHEDLLRHRAGYVAWTPLYRRCRSPREAARALLDPTLLGARAGAYSDLGYILWGLSARRVTRQPVAGLLRQHVLVPLGVEGSLTARPRAARCAACRLDTDREVALAREQGLRVGRLGPPRPGTPQDGNTRFLGGYAGHAGLFGTPQGLVELARDSLAHGASFPARTAATATDLGRARAATDGGDVVPLGWRPARKRGSAGSALSREAFGHDGFTGGSCWIDPSLTRIFVLLTHRVQVDVDLGPWRRRFHRMGVAM
jgi:CubicO group peptidase (beta-lactamase class C family)